MYEKLQAQLEATAQQLVSRRETWQMAALALGASGVGWQANATAAKRKKKGKNKKKKTGACTSPYFTCGGACKLAGACCDAIPALSCAATHGNQPGTKWICCDIGNFCVDSWNDDVNCGACGNVCGLGRHCLHGTCV